MTITLVQFTYMVWDASGNCIGAYVCQWPYFTSSTIIYWCSLEYPNELSWDLYFSSSVWVIVNTSRVCSTPQNNVVGMCILQYIYLSDHQSTEREYVVPQKAIPEPALFYVCLTDPWISISTWVTISLLKESTEYLRELSRNLYFSVSN